MNQRALIVAIVLFLLIVFGMFLYARMKREEVTRNEPTAPMPPEQRPESLTHIDAKHFFRNGTHTIVGEIELPTPCDLLESEAVVRESFPEQVTINFSIRNNTQGVCAQVITLQRFKTSFQASEHASIDATFNGRPVILNLIKAGPEENPDDFEVFIKE